MSLLITFYEGSQPDHRGRYLSDILEWDANKLESAHDYIQIVFPLPEESGVQWNAPTINRQVFDAFRARPELRQRLKESFRKILWFYGFVLVEREDGIEVGRGANWDSHYAHWDARFDHNHLRITRIIRCLRVLGLEDEALAFYDALEQSACLVSSRSREYWRRAAKRTLNLRPDLEYGQIDGDDDLSVGPKFLREFEELRKQIAEARTADGSLDATAATNTVTGDDAIEKKDRTGTEKVKVGETNVKGTDNADSAVKRASGENVDGVGTGPRVGDGHGGPK
ncbi:opioid growth factor receptor conserved region-domain-containing protein [Cadophora sp. MPI-SDFR-AT-0126]|nr:opioid growth factor receptor conserved region-domain-containing protein [Leotiomycetes sp. MPI-SDFR-AT-0126]